VSALARAGAPHLRVLSMRDCTNLTDRGAFRAAVLPALRSISFPKTVSKDGAVAFQRVAPAAHVIGP
jgi:hypothetical protein